MSNIDKVYKSLISISIILLNIAYADNTAERYFEAREWAAAADAYAIRAEESPDDVAAWFRLAVSARHAERYAEAHDALDMAEKQQFSPVRVGLERARLNVLADNPMGALAELRAISASGFTAVNAITADPVLATLAGVDGFDALVAEMSKQAFPCEHDAAFSEFDFWIGEWDVHVANGTYAGSNRIDRAQHGCVLIEYWSSATGGTGTSINYLDKRSGEWVQIWNDAGGNQINIRGGMTPDGMSLTGTIHYVANGTTAPFRGLWTPMQDGRVRQFFEQGAVTDETWSPWFEGFYSRKSDD